MNHSKARVLSALVASSALGWASPGRAAEPSDPSAPPAASKFHADAEVDPTAYALDGYSLHVGVGYARVRLDIGAYAMAIPNFVHGNDDFNVAMDGYGAKLQYFPFGEQVGGFIGIDGGVMRLNVGRKGTDLARRDKQVGVGIDAGWRFNLGAGFYATPWLGVGYAFGTDDVTLAGKTFESSKVSVFPAVHVGYGFR